MKTLALVCIFFSTSVSFAQNHNKFVGCYWATWGFYRVGNGRFDVPDIDPSLCTHGMYAYANLDNATWTIKVWNPL